ncbi:hypothetical protein [Ferrimonas pelagia]|uniref:Uncharacterized protein n=1 Tax=Ferrimonas pelagia TaxID=1177826 RepID=A0ABP9EK94_9GAMM
MKTLKQVRSDLRVWGKVIAASREGQGWPRTNSIERIRDIAQTGVISAGTQHLFSHQAEAIYYPEWVEQTTAAVDAVSFAPARLMLVRHYVQGYPLRLLERHERTWLRSGEAEVMGLL